MFVDTEGMIVIVSMTCSSHFEYQIVQEWIVGVLGCDESFDSGLTWRRHDGILGRLCLSVGRSYLYPEYSSHLA